MRNMHRNNNWKGGKYIPKTIYTKAKHGAKNRRAGAVEFSITLDDLDDQWEKQGGRCAYTDMPLTLGANVPHTASLDRVDSDLGYILGNIQWVHKDVNKMKSNFTEDRFLELCQLVAKGEVDTYEVVDGKD